MSRLEELIQTLCPDGVENKTVGELCVVYTGGEAPEDFLRAKVPVGDYIYPIFSNGINENSIYGYSKEYRIGEDAVTFSSIGTIGFPTIRKGKFTPIIRLKVIIPKKDSGLTLSYLKYALETASFAKNKSSVPNINADMIKNIVVPLPPLPVQEEIVRILDTFSGVVAELEQKLNAEQAARVRQYEHYRNELLSFDSKSKIMEKLLADYCPEGVEFIPLKQVLDYSQPTPYIVKSTLYDDSYDTPVLTAGASFILGYTDEKKGIYNASHEKPVIIFDDFTTSFHWVDFNFKVKSSALKILTEAKQKIAVLRYVFYAMQCIKYQPSQHARQWIQTYSKIQIPLPPLPVQEEIVSILDRFNTLVNDLKSGLPGEIALRRKQYEYYRDKLLTFHPLS